MIEARVTKKSTAEKVMEKPKSSEKLAITAEAWPSNIPLPTSEVKCECSDHYEKVEVDMTFPVSAKALFDTLFTGASFFQDIHENRKDWDIKIGEWSSESPSKREVSWMFKVDNPMTKVKETDCVEAQTLLKKNEHLCYVVDCQSRTVNMPYGDAFQTTTRYCITFASAQSCRLLITIGVAFSKNPLVKCMLFANFTLFITRL